MFWKQVFESTMKDWVESCKRGDSLKKRTMYVNRLNAVLANMAQQTREKANEG